MEFRPSIIWAMDFDGGQAVACHEQDSACRPTCGQFRWLHLNLADQLTREWIKAADGLPKPMKDMLLTSETHQRAIVEEGFVGCVLHDVERDFDRLDAERTGILRPTLGTELMVTARHHPLRA